MTHPSLSLRTLPVRTVALGLLAASLSLAASAATLTGTVTNRTTGKPSAGDDVIVLNLQNGMQEGGRTKTDSRGRYSIEMTDGPHVVRVDHQKASNFKPAPPGTSSLDIDVYDVAEKVEGVTTEADVLRLETDPQGLHVVENFFVKNDSNPPRTQFSDHAYEISLPPDARIEGSAAMSPGGMPVSSSPVPLAEKGRYAFVFALRPGETRFQVSYHLPYSGSLKFTPKFYLPTQNVAIMLPKGMTFQASGPISFQQVPDDVAAQTFLAKNVPPATQIEFTVSGTGSMPRDSQQGQGDQGQGPEASQNPDTTSTDQRPGGGMAKPIDTPDPLTKYRWWILGGLAVILAIAAGFLLRPRPEPALAVAAPPAEPPPAPLARPASAPPAQAAHNGLLAVLKDELFTLETERLEGKLTESEYLETKASLEVVLRRALSRQTR